MATDSSGNIYVADQFNHTIRKITPAGRVTTLAGLAGTPGSADGARYAARFRNPNDVAVDSSGNVYVADKSNHTIRKITPTGVVTTLAGLAGNAGSVNDTGSAARFSSPGGVAVDSSGNVYVADTDNHLIRRITPAAVVTTLAGTAGVPGSTNSPGALFNYPNDVATDSSGNVIVADRNNHTIRKVTPLGVVTTLAGMAGVSGTAEGPVADARFFGPSAVAVDAGGNVYVADRDNHAIRVIATGNVTTVAGERGVQGNVDATGTAARFFFPTGLAVGTGGNVYVADQASASIRRIASGGVVTTLAGLAGPAGSTDATGNAARFSYPYGMAADDTGNLYVADYRNHTIRRISTAGVVTTFAGLAGTAGSDEGTGSAARFRNPAGVTTDASNNVYVADQFNHTIRKITPAGDVTTFAGSAGLAGSVDQPGADARFNLPGGLTSDGFNIYVADYGNHTIRMINGFGDVSTLAGFPGQAGSDNGSGSSARFNGPAAIALGPGGLYVADYGSHTIRQISGDFVMTLAGLAGNAGSTNGFADAARFNRPAGVACDASGNVYIADRENHTIRKIDSSGMVTTFGGLPGVAGNADGEGTARFNYPNGLVFDNSGKLFVADSENNRIRMGKPAGSFVATIDLPSGAVGSPRQLDALPPTATSWQWSVIRQAGNSSAQLSSTSIRNPVFTPMIADLYTFQLIATDGSNTSITTVDLTVTRAATTTTVTSTPNPSVSQSPVTLRGTVTPGATGTIIFREGIFDGDFLGNDICTGTLDGSGQATCTTSSFQVGSRSIYAFYSGDENYQDSISAQYFHTVNPLPFGAPQFLYATAYVSTAVELYWPPVTDADHYEVFRSWGNAPFAFFVSEPSNVFTDTTVSQATTYLYKVRAVKSDGSLSGFSPVDPATTIEFVDNIIRGTTIIKAVHILQLRQAVNLVRASVGQAPFSFTDPGLAAGTVIKAVHISQLRTALTAARTALGLSDVYTDDPLVGGTTLVDTTHIYNLRDRVQ